MQSDQSVVLGPVAAFSAVLRDSPSRGFLRCSAFVNGIVPTGIGYWMQGATKFGMYEVIKQRGLGLLRGSGGEESVRRWGLPVMLSSAAAAEMCATVLLAPMEVLKLRVQARALRLLRSRPQLISLIPFLWASSTHLRCQPQAHTTTTRMHPLNNLAATTVLAATRPTQYRPPEGRCAPS